MWPGMCLSEVQQLGSLLCCSSSPHASGECCADLNDGLLDVTYLFNPSEEMDVPALVQALLQPDGQVSLADLGLQL